MRRAPRVAVVLGASIAGFPWPSGTPAAAGPEPVPMPEVVASEVALVPIPLVRPTEPGPVPLPRVGSPGRPGGIVLPGTLPGTAER